MDKPLYVIHGWNASFENSESRKVKRANFVCVPNKHDGKSYRRLTRVKDAPLIYCGWQLMLQLASKMPVRGVLADHDGPLDAEDMADKTGFPVSVFDRALKSLVDEKIGWLQRVEATEIAHFWQNLPTHRDNLPASAGTSRRTGTISRHLPEPPDASQEKNSEPNRVTPGDTPDAPGQSPGIPQLLPTPPGTPADAGPRGRARENRREGNRTEDPPYAPQGGLEWEAVVERIAPLFNQSPDRPLNQPALLALSRIVPVPEEELELVAWFYGLPGDERVRELDTRHTKLKTLFENWSDAVGVARTYAKKEGAVFGAEKKERAAVEEPEGWRERLLAEFPEGELPARFAELPASLKKIARGERAEVPA